MNIGWDVISVDFEEEWNRVYLIYCEFFHENWIFFYNDEIIGYNFVKEERKERYEKGKKQMFEANKIAWL